MKVRNIAFSGFMAAIMASSATAAPIKTIKIATQSYVDEKEAVVEQKVIQKVDQKIQYVEENLEQNYVKHAVLGDMGLAEGETVSGKISDVEGRLDTAEGGIKALEQEIETLQGGVGSVDAQIKTVTGELSGLATENKENLVGAINEVGSAVATVQGVANSASAAATANAGEITTLKAQQVSQDETIAGVAEDVNANYLAITELQGQHGELSGRITTAEGQLTSLGAAIDKIAGGKVDYKGGDYVNVDNATGLITLEVDTEITPEAKELATSYAVYNYVNAYAIPKPETDCLEGEKLCVLSIDAAGQMVWVSVRLGKDGKIQ